MQKQWDRIETAIRKGAKEFLGKETKKKPKDWFGESYKDLIKQKDLV